MTGPYRERQDSGAPAKGTFRARARAFAEHAAGFLMFWAYILGTLLVAFIVGHRFSAPLGFGVVVLAMVLPVPVLWWWEGGDTRR